MKKQLKVLFSLVIAGLFILGFSFSGCKTQEPVGHDDVPYYHPDIFEEQEDDYYDYQ